MKFVVSPDSFKGSLTAEQAVQAMCEGIGSVYPDAQICALPIADGGEGTMQVMYAASGGKLIYKTVPGPYGEPVEASYLLQGDTAVIELAKASGLTLSEKRNPMVASTYGTGLLIKDALMQGAEQICLTLGGSATNDGGAGIAAALGIRILDKEGNAVEPNCEGLAKAVDIDASTLHPRARACSWKIACDVSNALCGPTGASAIYGPQKGADAEMVRQMDSILADYGRLIQKKSGKDIAKKPGSGAAGGAAVPLMAFLEVQMCAGIDMILDAVGFDLALAGANWVFTGEGKIDGQTRFGKAIAGIGRRAARQGVPVGVFAGALGITQKDCPEGMYLQCISDTNATLEENMANAYYNLKQAVISFLQKREEITCQPY